MGRRIFAVFTLVLALGALTSGCASAPGPQAFAGQTVVVTGASSGFGRGVSLEFGERGANVVVAARRTAALDAVAEEIRALGGQALVVTIDVAEEADVARLGQAAVERFGRIDVWINNAGVGVLGRFEEAPVQDHVRVIDVNLKGVIYGSHYALRQFRRQGAGTLINIGSVVSETPFPYYASYSASKHGVLGLSASIAQEMRLNGHRDIKVVTVMPFAADTPWFDHAATYAGRRPHMIMKDDPQKVIDAIVRAAAHPRRKVAVGWKAKGALAAHRLLPGLTEDLSADLVHRVQIDGAPPAPSGPGALYTPNPDTTTVEGRPQP